MEVYVGKHIAPIIEWMVVAPEAHLEIKDGQYTNFTHPTCVKIGSFITFQDAAGWLKYMEQGRYCPSFKGRAQREGSPIWRPQPMLPDFTIHLGRKVQTVHYQQTEEVMRDPGIFLLPQSPKTLFFWGELAILILEQAGEMNRLVPSINPVFNCDFKDIGKKNFADSRH